MGSLRTCWRADVPRSSWAWDLYIFVHPICTWGCRKPPVSALSNAVRAIFEFALRVSSLLSLSPPSSLSPFSFFLFNCFGQRCENTAGLGAKQCRQGDFRICPPSLLSSLSLSSFFSLSFFLLSF